MTECCNEHISLVGIALFQITWLLVTDLFLNEISNFCGYLYKTNYYQRKLNNETKRNTTNEHVINIVFYANTEYKFWNFVCFVKQLFWNIKSFLINC